MYWKRYLLLKNVFVKQKVFVTGKCICYAKKAIITEKVICCRKCICY